MCSQPLTGSSSRLLARGVHLFSEKSLNVGWVQGDCLKPPSRFGKAGGREELEEVGARQGCWDEGQVYVSVHIFPPFLKCVLDRNKTFGVNEARNDPECRE